MRGLLVVLVAFSWLGSHHNTADAQGVRHLAKNNAQRAPRSQRKPKAAAKPKDVSPLCAVCEMVALGVYGIMSKRLKLTARAWENRLRDLCGNELGCDIFLSKKNAVVLGRTLQELAAAADGGRLPALPDLQAKLCFDITEACPSGRRGERKHQFQKVESPPLLPAVDVKVRFWSLLAVGKVHVYWFNPVRSRDTPLSGTLVPGGSFVQRSFSGHTFRLLGPGVQWDDKVNRLAVTLNEAHEQHFEVSCNQSWVPDMPAFIADPDAAAPAVVVNPEAVYNRRYVIEEVFSRGFRSEL